ncbi:MAG: HDOD domain-containing protein [Opitutaceae bacterium]
MGYEVSELLKGMRSLPVAPQIVPRLQALLSNLDSDNNELAATIRLDAGLAARVLKASNSAFHARGSAVASIEDALQTLGYQETFRIVAQSSFGPFFNRPLEIYHLESGLLWDVSLITASALEQLCRSSTTDPNTGYVVGLLHAVGRVPINDFVLQMDFRPMPDLSNPANSVRLEIALLGHNFGEVGSALLRSWGFPAVITEVIAHQCTPALAGDHADLTSRLHLASSWVEELYARSAGVSIPRQAVDAAGLHDLGLKEDQVREIKNTAYQSWQAARKGI